MGGPGPRRWWRCWLDAADLDPQWRMEKVRLRVARTFASAVVVNALQTIQAAYSSLEGERRSGSSLVGHLGAEVVVFVVMVVFYNTGSKHARSLEVFEAVLTWAAFAFKALASYAEEDDVPRYRGLISMAVFGYGFPFFTCMRVKLYAGYVVMHCFTCLATILAAFERYGSTWYDVQGFFTTTLLAVAFMPMAFAQGLMLKSFENSENCLRQERLASQSLVSMLCDAWFVLDADGSTVLQTDGRFDSLVSRAMVGRPLEEAVGRDSKTREQLEHFRKLLQGLIDSPEGEAAAPVAPVTLESHGGGQVRGTLFAVVSRGSSGAAAGALGTSFLVGLCQADEERRLEATGSTVDCTPASLAAFRPSPEADLISCDSEAGRASERSVRTADAFRVDGVGGLYAALKQVRDIGRQEHWLLDHASVELHPVPLGAGGYGAVLSGRHFGGRVAVKLVNVKGSRGHFKSARSLIHELRVLRHCRHSNLLQLQGAVVDLPRLQIGLVLELAAGGDLKALMTQAPPSEGVRFRLACGIACGLWFLHGQQPAIVHGDLKPANVLLCTEGRLPTAKLADFGLSLLQGPGATPSVGGTLKWQAPEVWQRLLVGQPVSDMYSFGHLLAYLATGREPWLEKLEGGRAERAAAAPPERPPWPRPRTPLQECLEPLAASCLSPAWSDRPLAEEALRQLLALPVASFDDERGVAAATVAEASGGIAWDRAFPTEAAAEAGDATKVSL